MTTDRFAEKYTSMTPYQYGANNPILNIDVNGDSIDVSNLNNEELEIYTNIISSMRSNKLFNEYYGDLEESETVYTINFGPGEGGSGSFNPATNEIFFIEDISTMAQEIFHAYQSDTGLYDKNDQSVRETEGDLVSGNVAQSLGRMSMGSSFWDQNIPYEFVDNDLNFNGSVLTDEFDEKFNDAVNARINFYKERERTSGAKAPKSYVQPNSGKGAVALKRLIRQINQKR